MAHGALCHFPYAGDKNSGYYIKKESSSWRTLPLPVRRRQKLGLLHQEGELELINANTSLLGVQD
jgi:hypothetical protein